MAALLGVGGWRVTRQGVAGGAADGDCRIWVPFGIRSEPPEIGMQKGLPTSNVGEKDFYLLASYLWDVRVVGRRLALRCLSFAIVVPQLGRRFKCWYSRKADATTFGSTQGGRIES
jgi:hypothetical protein